MKLKYSLGPAMELLGIEHLRKHQIQPIDDILAGKDTLVIAPTSSGKSAIFQIPALVQATGRQRWTLVIEPTLSLIHDQVQALNASGLHAEALTSYNKEQHPAIWKELSEHQITLLYVTPEQLESSHFLQTVCNHCPWLVVVDEAHCVLDWGFTFRSSYLNIKCFLKSLKHRPVVAAFTATAPPEYHKALCSCLGMEKIKIHVQSLRRENLILCKEDCTGLGIKRRLSRVKYNLKKYGEDSRAVVYCATRKNVDIVTNYLSKQFPGEVVKCHAYMDSDKRKKHEMQFIEGRKRIMVATTAFGMGVNVSDIRVVIHFNLPLSTIDYYQQIGRAGRDGERAHAVLLYDPEDIALNRNVITNEQYSVALQEWLSDRLDEMCSIAKSEKCLMRQLLSSLGEKHANTCRHCTNCQRARRNHHED